MENAPSAQIRAWSRTFVFGVATEYCVRLAAKGLLERGRRVSVVKDAIETLKAEDETRTVAELQALGAKFITTDQALELLNSQPYGNRTSKL